MDKNKLLVIILATIVSGATSGYFLANGDRYGQIVIFDSPGIAFGLTTAVAFGFLYRSKIIKLIAWAVTSWLSWRVALNIYITLGEPNAYNYDELTRLMAAGLTGAILLALLFWALIEKSSVLKVLIAGTAGLVGALGIYLMLERFDSNIANRAASFIAAFITWQVLVGSALLLDIPLLQTKK